MAEKISVTAFATMIGPERSKIPYTSQQPTPVESNNHMTRLMSAVLFVRKAFKA